MSDSFSCIGGFALQFVFRVAVVIPRGWLRAHLSVAAGLLFAPRSTGSGRGVVHSGPRFPHAAIRGFAKASRPHRRGEVIGRSSRSVSASGASGSGRIGSGVTQASARFGGRALGGCVSRGLRFLWLRFSASLLPESGRRRAFHLFVVFSNRRLSASACDLPARPRRNKCRIVGRSHEGLRPSINLGLHSSSFALLFFLGRFFFRVLIVLGIFRGPACFSAFLLAGSLGRVAGTQSRWSEGRERTQGCRASIHRRCGKTDWHSIASQHVIAPERRRRTGTGRCGRGMDGIAGWILFLPNGTICIVKTRCC